MTLFKVMTWNLENLFEPGTEFGPDTQDKYHQKLVRLADVILVLDPDVLAVQEVGSPAAFHELVNLLQGRYPDLRLSAHPDSRGIRVGFLSKFVIDETEEILAFPQAGLPKVPGLDQQGNLIDVSSLGRGALRIQVSPTAEFPINFLTPPEIQTANLSIGNGQTALFPERRKRACSSGGHSSTQASG